MLGVEISCTDHKLTKVLLETVNFIANFHQFLGRENAEYNS